MTFSFSWNMGYLLFKRLRRSSVRLAFSVCAATIIAIAALCVWQQSRDTVRSHVEAITLSLFVPTGDSTLVASDIADDLRSRVAPELVQSVIVLSPDSVRAMFDSKYNVNTNEILPSNPFPSVVSINFNAASLERRGFDAIIMQCMELQGVEISYRSDFVRAVFQEQDLLFWATAIGGLLCGGLIVLLLFFAVRAENIYSLADAHYASLLGASTSLVRVSSLSRNALSTLIGIALGAFFSAVVLLYTDLIYVTRVFNDLWYIIPLSALFVVLCVIIITLTTLPTSPKPTRGLSK